MAVAESVLVFTDEDGNVTRCPLLKSTLLKFERRYKRPFTQNSTVDMAAMSFYLAHDQRWPPSDPELDDWFDSVTIDVEDQGEAAANGDHPPGPPPQLT